MLRSVGEHTDRVSSNAPRIFHATYAGEGTDTLTLIFEHDSMSHLGERVDREEADEEYQRHLADLVAHGDPPIETVRSAILTEMT